MSKKFLAERMHVSSSSVLVFTLVRGFYKENDRMHRCRNVQCLARKTRKCERILLWCKANSMGKRRKKITRSNEEKGNKQINATCLLRIKCTRTQTLTHISIKIYRTRKYLHESNEDKSEKRNLLIEGT